MMNQPAIPHAMMIASSRQVAYGRQRGMTLIEIMIVMAVVGFVMLLGYNAVRVVTDSVLRENSIEVAQVLGAAYNMATVTGKHHRVVFNFEEQSYRIESCEGDIRLRFADKEEEREDGDEPKSAEDIQRTLRDSSIPAEVAQATSPEDAAKMAAALTGERVGTATCSPPELPTGDRDGRGIARKLDVDSDIKIRRMFVQHLEGEQSAGVVHVNFFPLGYSEKTLIEVGDEDGDAYTILVHAFTGRIEMRTGRVDEDEFMYRRADGERVGER